MRWLSVKYFRYTTAHEKLTGDFMQNIVRTCTFSLEEKLEFCTWFKIWFSLTGFKEIS
jgi:hypothetical protein